MKRNTHWSTPKTNVFSAVSDLSKALNAGYRAALIKEYNENVQHPIRKKNQHNDFRAYEFNIGIFSTHESIMNSNISDFEKYLSLNYKVCYGSQDAVNKYYQTGILSMDNIRGVGVSHLVKVTDLIELLKKNNPDGSKSGRIEMLTKQYVNRNTQERVQVYDFFKLKGGYNEWAIKRFKNKLWVVTLLGNDEVAPKQPLMVKVLLKIMNGIHMISKYIPKKSKIKLDDYTIHSFRFGNLSSGLIFEIHVPRKISFH